MGEVTRRSLRSTQNIDDAFLDVSESDIRAIRNETAELINTFVRILFFIHFDVKVERLHAYRKRR